MSYSYLFAALTHSFLAVVCLRLLGRKGSLSFALLPLTGALALTAAWGWHGMALHPDPAPFSGGLHLLLDAGRYACWFAFLLVLLLPGGVPGRWPLSGRVLAASAALLVGASLVPALALLAGQRLPALLLRWMALAWMFLPILGLVLLEQVHRNTPQPLRWAMKPLALALLGVFAFDLYLTSRALLLSEADPASIAMRGLVHGLSAPLLGAALHRHHGKSLAHVALSRQAAFHTAALLLIGSYLLLVALAGYSVRDFDAAWGQALQLSFLFAALLAGAVVALSGTARSALRVAIGKTFYRDRYDYRAEWLRFTARLAGRDGGQDLGETVVRGLAEMVESPAGVLWTPHPDGTRYVPSVRWNMPCDQAGEARQSPLVRFLAEREWIVELDEFRRDPQRYGGLQLPPWLMASPQWLVIPLLAGRELVGFVVLASPRVPVRVDWEVRDLLKTAGRQAAAFLAQVAATEALMENRRFEAFNRMSAFVVHDLKNVVTQLSLMMRNARRLHADPEFQQDMLATVESSLEKMRGLIRQLREGEAPADTGAAGVDLVPLARRLRGLCTVQGRSLDASAPAELWVRGDEERLFRVLGHLVQNALDATTPSDRVWLSMSPSAQHAVIVVGDTGQGMAAEFVSSQLFRPFHTTKTHGMGIGFYESARYVQELGGRIEVDSEVGRGTRITLHLPLHHASAPPPMHEEPAR